MTMSTHAPPVYGRSYGPNAAENYEQYFVPVIGGPFGLDLVQDAELQPGERVLDVACGTGVIARLAARHVAPNGSVAALDINAAMLSVARSLPAELPIKWYETAAESVPLPDASFDVVFCQLGLQFMTDQAAALREMHRVLRPGGRIFVNTPVPNPLFDVLDREIARHVSKEAAVFVQAVFSLNDPGQLRDLLTTAGFSAAKVRTHRKQLALPSARDFMWQYIHCTPLIALVPPSEDARSEALERAVVAGWQPWTTANGMRCQQAVLVATGSS